MELFLEMIPPGSLCNPDTHSNIFVSFVRIFQFSEKYCSLPASGKFPFSPFGKGFVPKDPHVLTDTVVQSPENVFLVEVRLC